MQKVLFFASSFSQCPIVIRIILKISCIKTGFVLKLGTASDVIGKGTIDTTFFKENPKTHFQQD